MPPSSSYSTRREPCSYWRQSLQPFLYLPLLHLFASAKDRSTNGSSVFVTVGEAEAITSFSSWNTSRSYACLRASANVRKAPSLTAAYTCSTQFVFEGMPVAPSKALVDEPTSSRPALMSLTPSPAKKNGGLLNRWIHSDASNIPSSEAQDGSDNRDTLCCHVSN